MKQSKSAIVMSQIVEKLQLIVGTFITILFGITGIMGTVDGYTEIDVVIATYILTAIGVTLIMFSRKRHNLIKNFRIYILQLSLNPTGSIENLAIELGISQDIIKKNLNIMIDRKYFVNAFIDEEENRIVFPASSAFETTSDKDRAAEKDNTNNEFIVVNCKHCGGINRIQNGRASQCEYCGSYIK